MAERRRPAAQPSPRTRRRTRQPRAGYRRSSDTGSRATDPAFPWLGNRSRGTGAALELTLSIDHGVVDLTGCPRRRRARRALCVPGLRPAGRRGSRGPRAHRQARSAAKAGGLGPSDSPTTGARGSTPGSTSHRPMPLYFSPGRAPRSPPRGAPVPLPAASVDVVNADLLRGYPPRPRARRSPWPSQ